MTTPKLLRYLEGKRSPFVSNINKLMKKVETILNQEKVFPDHSLYDIDHSIRVMDYIYYLIPSIYKLSDLEITLLIYSALLHDIGMFAAEEEIEQIKKNRSDLVEMDFASVLLNNSGNEVEALQYCIRTTHGKRAAAWINKHSKEFCIIPFHSGISFAREVGLICQGHTESPEWLEKKLPNHNEKAGYEYNTYFCALLLRLGDILDIDSRRVPPALLDLLTSEGISPDEWKKNISIENSRMIRRDDYLNRKYIELYGECKSNRIYQKLIEYVDGIQQEIILCNESTRDWQKRYRMNLYYPMHVNLKTVDDSDLLFIIDYSKAEQLLKGENLYYSRKVGLREIIQNSLDACSIRKEVEDNNIQAGQLPYEPFIKLIIDENEKTVTVKDNGIGMTLETIKNYLLDVGTSYYNSDDFKNEGYKYKPIAKFGIGFFASLMLSDEVIVKTRHYRENVLHQITVQKNSNIVQIEQKTARDFEGTEVILDYEKFMRSMNNADECASYIEQNFLFHNIHFEVVIADTQVSATS